MAREKKVLVFLATMVGIGFFVIIYRLYSIQVLKHEKLDRYSSFSEVIKVVKSKRGAIKDSKGEILALSEPKVDLAVDPAGIAEKELMARSLAVITGRKKTKLLKILKKKGHFYYIKKNLGYAAIEAFKKEKSEIRKRLKTLKRDENADGAEIKRLSRALSDFNFIILLDGYRRIYPQGNLFANVLGFVRTTDSRGLEGLEMSYNSYLGGKDRKIKRLYIPGSGEGSLDVEKELLDNAGADLVTTIDSRIQYIAEEELGKMMKKSKAKWGSVVAMNPENGKILAMANYPTFNPERYFKYSPRERRNYSVANLFEPGSTMKVFSIVSVMNDNHVKPGEIFYGHKGRYRYGRRWVRDHKVITWMSLKDIVVYSSNIGTILLTDRLSSKRLYEYFGMFGFGRKSGIQLPGESYKKIRDYKKWYPIDKGNISFGQGIATNVVHNVRAMSALFNGGVLWQPTIVDRVENPRTGEILYETKPVPERIDFRYDSDVRMKKMLVKVVEEGTAKKARIKGIEVAGKTGTSQKYDASRGKYSWNRVVCSFLGAVPADRPKLVMMVVIDEPAGREFGGTVAAPVFREVAKRSLPLLGVYLEKDDGEDKSEKSSIPYENEITAPFLPDQGKPDVSPLDLVKVPSLKGLTISKAIHLANKSGLDIIVAGKGENLITGQYPKAGEMVSFGTVITLETDDKSEE